MGNRAFVPHTITSDSALGGSVIDHSIRFNRGDNPHFSRTPSSAGNRKVWTYSVWLKRTDFGARSFFQAYDGSSSRRFQLSFNGDDTLNFNQGGGGSSGLAVSYMMFRDPTAWYHIVAVADYTNSTAADRFKVYVNGSQISLNITDSIENADGQCNGAFEHEIGAIGSSGNVFDGYMADMNFIDGQALDASYFGYTEFQTKVWRPKRFIANGPNNGTVWSTTTNMNTNVFNGNFANNFLAQVSNGYYTATTAPFTVKQSLGVITDNGYHWGAQLNGSTQVTTGNLSNAMGVSDRTIVNFDLSSVTLPLNVTNLQLKAGTGSSGSTYIYGIVVDGVILIDGDVSNIGRNGFKLDLRDFSGDTATTIGRDYSGNGNNFSPDNFGGTGDGAIDSPTNNFTSFNKIMDYSLNAQIEEAGLRVEGPDTGHSDRRIFAPFAIPLTGKYYVEVKCVKNGARGTIGFSDGAISGGSSGNNWFSFGFYGGGYSTSFTKVGSNTSDFSVNDIVSFALDMDAGKMWLVKNGNVDVTAQESITAIVRTNLDRPLRWFYQETSSDESAALFNFGQFPYNYTVPDGFKTLSSRNIQPTYYDATNQPAKTFLKPKKHFETLLYTGNDTTGRVITDLEFQPDFVWIKMKSHAGDNHHLYDSIRGAGKTIFSNTDGVEQTSDTDRLSAFNSNGFTLGNNYRVNGSGRTFAAWCWKGGGAAVTNNDGTITTSVSVNEEAGFSIVSYSGTGSAGTIGHGLGKVPKCIITKRRTGTEDWKVYHVDSDGGKFLKLNSTQAQTSNSDVYPNTAPTSSVYSLGNHASVNGSGDTYIAYCWADIPGYSKFSSYVGNGNSNGVYAHLGFKPAMMIIKRIDATEDWWLHDYKRNPYNPVNDNLYPNGSEASAIETAVDHYADGFKLRTSNQNWNANGSTYVYLAWADQPGITTYGSSPTAR